MYQAKMFTSGERRKFESSECSCERGSYENAYLQSSAQSMDVASCLPSSSEGRGIQEPRTIHVLHSKKTHAGQAKTTLFESHE